MTNVHDTVNLQEEISGGLALIIFMLKNMKTKLWKQQRGQTKQVSTQGIKAPVE